MNTKTIGNYILEEKINQGGFGEIWKAHLAEDIDNKVAIKILSENSWIDYFGQEAKTIQKALSPSICKAMDADLKAQPPYIVMEYIPGKSLRQLLKEKGTMPGTEAVWMVKTILQIVSYIHRQGLVHCDLKPENVMVLPDGSLKLLDFGLCTTAKSQNSSVLLSGVLDTASRSGDVMGTLQYMSPEQKKGGPLGPESDLYSLGVMLFELTTGELPEFGDVPSNLNAALTPQLDSIFLKSVARRNQRYMTTGEFIRDLQALEQAMGVGTVSLGQTPPAVSPAAANSGVITSSFQQSSWNGHPASRWARFKDRVNHTFEVAYKTTKIGIILLLILSVIMVAPTVYQAGIIKEKEKNLTFAQRFKKAMERLLYLEEKDQSQKGIPKNLGPVEEKSASYASPNSIWKDIKKLPSDIGRYLMKKAQEIIDMIRDLITYVDRTDSKTLSPDEVTSLAKIEVELREYTSQYSKTGWDGIRDNPKKLRAWIEKLEQGLQELKKASETSKYPRLYSGMENYILNLFLAGLKEMEKGIPQKSVPVKNNKK